MSLTRLSSSRVLVAFLLCMVACASPPAGPVRYEGVAVNYESAAAPTTNSIAGTLTLIASPGAESSWTGEVLIGAPLLGSGSANVAAWGDSLLFLSVSATEDTLLWLGKREGTAYVGSYIVAGGPYSGQGGRWAVRQVSSQAIRPGDPPDAELRDWLTRELVALERIPDDGELDPGRQGIEAEISAPPVAK